MACFLSDAWLDALQNALVDVRLPAGSKPVTIAQVVVGDLGADEIVTEYRLCTDDRSTRIVGRGRGEGPDPDVTFVVDVATAAQLARGTTNAQRALAEGRCRLRGHPERLEAVATAMSSARDRLAALAADTEYPQ